MSKRCMGCMKEFEEEFQICPHCGYAVGTPAEEAIHMQPGTLLHDRYIIGRVLGAGGFGVTYIGWDGKLQQRVAVKEYLPGEFSTRMPGQSQITVFNGDRAEQFRDGMVKFVDEAKRLAKFQNEPGIVRIYDSFRENDTAYIIMEFLEGQTLAEYLADGKTIPEDRAVEMLTPIMESLQLVHDQGMLHRDIAPDNIFITVDGQIKLIDFGASRYATTSHSRSLTVIIKPGFSPEEQYRSRGDQGPHTDVYALAATLYKMITGKTPPDAMERRAMYENQNRDILVPPHKLCKGLSPAREVAILNALNVRIEDRTPDIRTFMGELNADPPAKRIYGKIKKLNFYAIPMWVKITVPTVLACLLICAGLMLTGVISFSRFTQEVVIPSGVVAAPDVEGMFKDQALQEIRSGKLLAKTGGSVESDYIPAGKIILQTPTGGMYMKINGTVLLTVSSGRGVATPENGVSVVPYVVWDSRQDAVDKLLLAGLGQPEIQEAYDDSVEPGHVISQSVEAGTQMKEGSTLTLVVSIGTAPFDMPDVTGMSVDEAHSLITEKGLMIQLEYEKSEDVPENHVIAQSLEAGSQVRQGDTVTLTVSSGLPTVELADVTGMSRDEAVAALEAQGFRANVLENHDDTVPEGHVIGQDPGAGSAQLPGAEIVVYVSKGPKMVEVPGVTGKSEDDAKALLQNLGLQVTVTREYRENVPQGQVIRQTPAGGARVRPGSAVELSVSLGSSRLNVQFHGNGGSAAESGRTYQIGDVYGQLPEASRTGHSFQGWFTAASGGKQIAESSKVEYRDLYAHWTPNAYSLYLDGRGGPDDVRTVSYGQPYGSLPSPSRDYYDFLGWFTAPDGGSQISESTTMGDGDVTAYAHWREHPLSDWVPESQVPGNARVEEEKWTYTRTTETESAESSLNGYSPTGSYWKQTDSGSRNYASFPSGFDRGHWIYGNMSSGAYSAYENETEKRVVSDAWGGYVYWHWMYDCGGSRGHAERAILDYRGIGPYTGWNYKFFYAFTSTQGNYSHDKGYCNSRHITNYIIPERADYSECGGATRWFRFEYRVSTYTDFVKMYQYRFTEDLESSSEVSAVGDISNVQRWVRYREK